MNHQRSALTRYRLVKICTWIALALALLAWAVSLAIDAPWTPWFSIVLWTVIGVGLVVRIVRGVKKKQRPLDAFQEMNQIYLGRTHSPSIDGTAPDSAEISHQFPDTGLASRQEDVTDSGETPPPRSSQ